MHMPMPHRLLVSLLLFAPLLASARDRACEHAQPRDLKLDVDASITTVVFDVGSQRLDIVASPGAPAAIQGSACASDAKALELLKLEQRKSGGKLYVTARRHGPSMGLFTSRTYAYMTLSATLPDSVAVQLKVGSGDASVSGSPVLSIDVGSGNVEASAIRGLVAAKVGSGDIELQDVGKLQVISIGSGDLSARRIGGDVEVDNIGSGDLDLRNVRGKVHIGSLGSGDASLAEVGGAVTLGSLGSGDLDVASAASLQVRSQGSGTVHHRNIGGEVSYPEKSRR